MTFCNRMKTDRHSWSKYWPPWGAPAIESQLFTDYRLEWGESSSRYRPPPCLGYTDQLKLIKIYQSINWVFEWKENNIISFETWPIKQWKQNQNGFFVKQTVIVRADPLLNKQFIEKWHQTPIFKKTIQKSVRFEGEFKCASEITFLTYILKTRNWII